MDRAVRALVIGLLTLTACGSRGETTTFDPLATFIVAPSLSAGPSPTGSLVAIATATAAPSSPPALPTRTPQATTPPPIPTPAPPSPTPTIGQTPSATPAQTRVPNSDAPPTPHGLPASDGCLYYGAQPPYTSFVDFVVHGLPPAAPVTLTANGDVVFLRIGSTVVFPDGSWYFPWYETQHKEIVFVVTASGVSRTLTQVFR